MRFLILGALCLFTVVWLTGTILCFKKGRKDIGLFALIFPASTTVMCVLLASVILTMTVNNTEEGNLEESFATLSASLSAVFGFWILVAFAPTLISLIIALRSKPRRPKRY